jgi:hypothetical protein
MALLLDPFIALLLGKRRFSFGFLMALLFHLPNNVFLLLSMGDFPLHLRKRLSSTFACRFSMVFSQRSFLLWLSQLDIKNHASHILLSKLASKYIIRIPSLSF